MGYSSLIFKIYSNDTLKYGLILLVSVLSMSTAGPVLATMDDTDIYQLSASRMQITACILAAAALYQTLQHGTDAKPSAVLFVDHKTPSMLYLSLLLILSGSFLGLHTLLWLASIQHTSLTHALFLVSCSPVVIAVVGWFASSILSSSSSSKSTKTNLKELVGVAIGLLGMVLLCSDASESLAGKNSTTRAGDVMAFVACLFFVAYIYCSRAISATGLRLGMHLAVVFNIAAIELSALVLWREPWLACTSRGGWGADTLKVMYLAIVPGLLGQAGFNAVLQGSSSSSSKYSIITPLLASITLNFCPVVGLGIGWLFGVSNGTPGVMAVLGGGCILISTITVCLANGKGEEKTIKAEYGVEMDNTL